MTTETKSIDVYFSDFGPVKLIQAAEMMDELHPRWREYLASKRFRSKRAKYVRQQWADIQTTARILSQIRFWSGSFEDVSL